MCLAKTIRLNVFPTHIAAPVANACSIGLTEEAFIFKNKCESDSLVATRFARSNWEDGPLLTHPGKRTPQKGEHR